MRWLVLALALVGCVNAELVECSDDRLCPRGTACDVVHHTCVAPDQLTVCDGMPDFTSCVATDVEAGLCFDGVCLPAGCGNGEVEPEELCDDGNTAGGDGCSSDCKSKEVCGDGFADKLRGEECDDGNTGTRDGCTNVCTLERPSWRLRLLDRPAPRADAGGAYDPLAGHLVVFGGTDANGALLDDTWGVDEVGWSTLYFGGPARRTAPALTWDRHAHRILMFGGFSGGTQGALLDDTWEWDGGTWTRRISPLVPPARMNSALASDGTRVLMFGGSQINDLLGDTWWWDGASWSRVVTQDAPEAREKHAMAFDPKHARFVLFGGTTPSALNDTWVFDGMSWAPLTTATKPPRMKWVALAYDAKREVLVLSGVDANTSENIVWELDGATWSPKPVALAPNISSGAVLAYDERRERVVQYSGRKQSTPELRNEVWEWSGTQWTLRGDPPLPQARQHCAIASDPVRGRVVMFGGQGPAGPIGDTWEWNGRGWSFATSLGGGPAPRLGVGIAFDGTEIMLFGGASSVVFDDTWHWNGNRWQQLSVTGPSARFGVSMAFDTKRQRVILFGGNTGAVYKADTWQWDGAAWTELTPPTSPPARMQAELVYDGKRDQLVLYGGIAPDGVTKLTDTWTFDGTTWTEALPPIRPEERSGFSVVYDRRRERTTLFGGLIASLSLWEWDGATWTQPESPIVPVIANGACAAYDDARSEIVAFGGSFLGVTQQTATGSFHGEHDEVCSAGEDLDGDGAAGCDDTDCRMVCMPLCWDVPGCSGGPRCGDGQCSVLEDEAGRACPADCP